VDYDLSWAFEAAKITAQENLFASFFVRISSPHYNPLTSENIGRLRRIQALGHDVGLHYFHKGQKLNISRLEKEFTILQTILPKTVNVVAWHNPPNCMDNINKAAENAGFVTVYDKRWFGKELYISDSNAPNNFMLFLHKLLQSNAPLIQILLHPVIWIIGGESMPIILQKAFFKKIDKLDLCFHDNLHWHNGAGTNLLKAIKGIRKQFLEE